LLIHAANEDIRMVPSFRAFRHQGKMLLLKFKNMVPNDVTQRQKPSALYSATKMCHERVEIIFITVAAHSTFA